MKMKAFAKFSVIVLIGIAYFAFPGFDWRHVLLIVAQVIILIAV